ncbi:MAG: putative addiction module antidote protein [Marinospirillum sp.]|uniref:addiction module antidote protein n=1 Tax=Marinospirillum sp. TaxID=2183934 RepID=UPI0019E081D2|nr:addiction module antidote protein [Marinospirillum sp.]MBE0506487.1 putative addiction module antidote protein [Marinospirillum sp.]
MTLHLNEFTFAQGIETKEDMALYLSAFLEEGGIDGLLVGLRYLVKEKGITDTAQLSGLNRQHLHRILGKQTKPKFETVDKLLHALGFKMAVEVVEVA